MKGLIIKSKKLGEFCFLYDDIDHDIISKYRWHVHKGRYTTYAMSSPNKKNPKAILMHRLIMNVTNSKIQVDHINRCGLDNTRSNLRISTQSENMHNGGPFLGNKSGYRGVCTTKAGKDKFRAQIYVNKKPIYLGCFNTSREAALAYNQAAIKYFGEFACINNIT